LQGNDLQVPCQILPDGKFSDLLGRTVRQGQRVFSHSLGQKQPFKLARTAQR
jgi:hypothetical protein